MICGVCDGVLVVVFVFFSVVNMDSWLIRMWVDWWIVFFGVIMLFVLMFIMSLLRLVCCLICVFLIV